MKKLRVTVDGKAYEVIVESLDAPEKPAAPAAPTTSAPIATPAPVPQAPPAAPAAPAPAAAPAAGGVPSPLAGRIVSIDCAVGQKVDAGAQLVTLEAMKMNTYVTAPGAGTVSAILVNPADAVEEGQILVTIG